MTSVSGLVSDKVNATDQSGIAGGDRLASVQGQTIRHRALNLMVTIIDLWSFKFTLNSCYYMHRTGNWAPRSNWISSRLSYKRHRRLLSRKQAYWTLHFLQHKDTYPTYWQNRIWHLRPRVLYIYSYKYKQLCLQGAECLQTEDANIPILSSSWPWLAAAVVLCTLA